MRLRLQLRSMAEKDLMAGSLTIESLRDLLRMKFQKIKESDDAVALITKQFKGTCKTPKLGKQMQAKEKIS